MSFRQKIAAETGLSQDSIPSSYQILGEVMLLKFLRCNDTEKKKIARCILELYPDVKTVCEITGIEGELRRPVVKKLAGNGTETTHKESGILYMLDVSKVMFSKGNHFERKRLLGQVTSREIIVDMFAGIGYFSLPLSKHVKKIYAIEKNPDAFHYLKKNIALNKASNMEAMNADCRDVSIVGADRVLMGYFPGTEKFLPFASRFLKKNGILYFHNVYKEDELWTKAEEHLKILGKFRILSKKKVKSVGPRMWHVVLDVQVNP